MAGMLGSTTHGPTESSEYTSRKRSPRLKTRYRFGMSAVPTSWMSRSNVVRFPTLTDLLKVLSMEICMFLVSTGDGVGSGDGVGDAVGATAAPPPPPQATSKRKAIAARVELLVRWS